MMSLDQLELQIQEWAMQCNVNYNISEIQTWNSRILGQSHIACGTHQFRDLSEATWEKEKQNTYIYFKILVTTELRI